MNYKQSLNHWNKAKEFIVPGSSTISKDPKLYTFGAYPIYLKEGKGAIVKDLDNNEYIDFQGSLGANILGTAYHTVNKAISKQLQKGTLFSLSTPLQTKLGKLICELVPCAEKIRILKNGSDATSAAVRIARAYTKKNKILSCHFHGWHDWYYITTSMNKGIPKHLKKDILEFEYNNLAALKDLFKQNKNKIAAIIMEPANLEAPKNNFLQNVKKLAHENKALLIFDEVVTGFRFAKGGAQDYFNVTPDLCCLAKALGNGMPISAVAGSSKIMEATKDVITSMTYGEETLSIASAIATLNEIKTKNVIEHIWNLGDYFQKEYNLLAKKYNVNTSCAGFAPRLNITFANYKNLTIHELKAYFLQESANEGILFGNMIFMNYSHKKSHVKQALSVCKKIFQNLKQLKTNEKPSLKGDLPVELW